MNCGVITNFKTGCSFKSFCKRIPRKLKKKNRKIADKFNKDLDLIIHSK